MSSKSNIKTVKQKNSNTGKPPKIRYGKPLALDAELNSLVNNNKIDMDRRFNLVKLTKSNSQIIENLILNDPGYVPFAGMIYKQLCNDNDGKFPNTDYAWTALIRIIDIDNSTRVWRFHRPEFKKS